MGNDPHGGRGRVCEGDMACLRVGHGMARQNYCVVGGCLLSLSLCRRDFQDLLMVRPSSLLIVCGAISLSHTCPWPPCGSLPFYCLLCNRTHLYPVTLFPIGSGCFWAKPFPIWIPQLFSNLVIIHVLAYEDGTECSEMSAYKIKTPGTYPDKNIQQFKYFLPLLLMLLCTHF
jgi:hypothetical protein